MWVDNKWDAVIWEFEEKKRKYKRSILYSILYHLGSKQHLCDFPLSLLTREESSNRLIQGVFSDVVKKLKCSSNTFAPLFCSSSKKLKQNFIKRNFLFQASKIGKICSFSKVSQLSDLKPGQNYMEWKW